MFLGFYDDVLVLVHCPFFSRRPLHVEAEDFPFGFGPVAKQRTMADQTRMRRCVPNQVEKEQVGFARVVTEAKAPPDLQELDNMQKIDSSGSHSPFA